MARRLVLGRRGGTTYGLWVSKSGVDALTAGSDQLLIDMNARYGMVLENGSAVVPAGGAALRVSFSRAYPSVPMVFCGPLTNYPRAATVSAQVDASGFFLRSVIDSRTGAYYAVGSTVQWFAVMQTEA